MLALAACGPNDRAGETAPRLVADRILTGGRIFTVNDSQPWAEAVAIKGERIIYVGDDAGAQAFAGDGTARNDLAGRLVIPGLVDAHTHPGGMGRYAAPGVLPTDSRESILTAVKTYAEENPDLDWIEMCCWPIRLYDMGRTGPHKQDLDRIVPDRPIWLTSDIGHSIWVNSRALELMGVDRNTPDPHPGVSFYVRDAEGNPTGWIKEKAFRRFRLEFFPVDRDRNRAGIATFLDFLVSHGVTTLMDAGNTYYSDEVYAYISELDRSGELPLRYEGTYHIFLPGQEDGAIAGLKKLREKYEGDRLKLRIVKIHFDGTNENRTGAVLEPYSDDPENRGDTVLNTDQLRDFILALNEERFDLHLHTVGDRAVRIALDATEAARAATAGQLHTRVAVSHLDIIDPADYARFRQLGVTAQYTPSWHGVDFDSPLIAAFGEERYARTMIARPLFDDGANVSFSSDVTSLSGAYGAEGANPYLGMQIAHNRQYPQGVESATAEIRGPESERLPLELVIKAYTLGGAYQLRVEDDLGSIETGKLADLVVLDRNLFEIDRYDIQNAKPVAVIMEGEIVRGGID
jgi:predicted amidohydrolase YtcJ